MELSHLTGQQLPEGWSVRPLGQLSGFITKGATPTTYGYSWQSDGVVFLRSECVSDHGLDLSEAAFISEKAHAALNRGEVRSGDLLVTITGYVGRAVLLDDDFGYGNINQHIARVRITDQSVDPKYVLYHLSQPEVRDYYESITTGQAYPQISLRQVRETPIPLPPPEEQRAIAAALSEVDDLVAALDAVIEKKRAVKTAAMQRLLTGRQRLPGFSGEWETRRLGEIATLGGGMSASRAQLSSEGHRYLHYGDIHVTDRTHAHVHEHYDNRPRLDIPLGKAKSSSLLQDGDVVFVDASEDEEGASRYVVVDNPTGIPFISGLHTIVAKGLTTRFDPLYMRYAFQAPVVKDQIRFYAVGTKVMGVSKSNLAKIEVPIPPRKEQEAIAAILTDMDAEVAALEARREKTRLIKQGMMQELLTGRTRLV